MVPLIIVLALAAPLSYGVRGEWSMAVGLAAKALLALAATGVFLGPLSLAALLSGLRQWGLPVTLVLFLGLHLRYVTVLQEERARMERARLARGGVVGGHWLRWSAWTQAARMLGALFLRAAARAERIHQAMLARGWTGTAPLSQSLLAVPVAPPSPSENSGNRSA